MTFHTDPEPTRDEPTSPGLDSKTDRCAAPEPTGIHDLEAHSFALGSHVRGLERSVRSLDKSVAALTNVARLQRANDDLRRNENIALRKSMAEFQAALVTEMNVLSEAVHAVLDVVRTRPCLLADDGCYVPPPPELPELRVAAGGAE